MMPAHTIHAGCVTVECTMLSCNFLTWQLLLVPESPSVCIYVCMYVCTVSYGYSGPQNHICSFLWPEAAPHLLITCSILASGCVRFFIAIRLATNHCRPVMPFSSHIPVKISPILIADAMQNGVSYPKVGEKWPDVRSTVLSCELYPAGVLNCQEVLPV